MRNIAFWSPKGGVGKTTLAINFAAAAYYAGYKVLLCDLDPQHSAMDLFSEKKLPFSVLPGKPQVVPNVDFLLFDHAPGIDLIPEADTIVLPQRASILDLKAVNRSMRLIRHKRLIRCVNAVDARRQEERMIAMKLYQEGALLIKDRSIYVRSVARGESIFQSNLYGSREAKAEINRILTQVLAEDR